jgi:hypothetical protein
MQTLRVQRYTTHFWRTIIVSLCVLSFVLTPLDRSSAQESSNSTRYENEELGIAIDIPTAWSVEADGLRLTMGMDSDLALLESGGLPANLIIVLRIATYNSLQLENAAQLSEAILKLAPSGITPSEPLTVNYGNSNGYEIEYTLTESALATRVMLLTTADGRIAIVRGMAAGEAWTAGASEEFEAIMQTISFTLPADVENSFVDMPDEDGGVLWHYQTAQIRDELPITLGGMTYDQTGVLYITAGSRGFLALNQGDGSYVNFLGPIFADDNFVDVAISPNAQLYFANATTNEERRIMVVDRVGNLQETWGEAGDGDGQFAEGMPRTIGITRTGDVWTVSEGHNTAPTNRLYRFNQAGILLATVDLDTLYEGIENVRVAVNVADEQIYVMGRQGGIHVLSFSGSVVATGLAADFLSDAEPIDIAITPDGSILVSTVNQGFLLFNTAGIAIDRFGYAYDAERGGAFLAGEYYRPIGIAGDASGNVYFAETHPDTGFAQVQAFSFIGEGNLPIAQQVSPAGERAGVSDATATGGDISVGDTVRGTLTNRSNRHDYYVRVQAGDTIIITMRDISPGQSLDPRLYLYDVNLNRLDQNDDIGEAAAADSSLDQYDAQIQFTFNTGSTYVIRAARFGGQGEYELSIVRAE